MPMLFCCLISKSEKHLIQQQSECSIADAGQRGHLVDYSASIQTADKEQRIMNNVYDW